MKSSIVAIAALAPICVGAACSTPTKPSATPDHAAYQRSAASNTVPEQPHDVPTPALGNKPAPPPTTPP